MPPTSVSRWLWRQTGASVLIYKHLRKRLNCKVLVVYSLYITQKEMEDLKELLSQSFGS